LKKGKSLPCGSQSSARKTAGVGCQGEKERGKEDSAWAGLMCIGPRKKNGPRGKEREGFGAFGLETSVESVVCFFSLPFYFKAYFKIT